jgi:mono/diheme cytochrome c family protein
MNSTTWEFMYPVLRWALRGLLVIVALALVVSGLVYALSERTMRRVYREPLPDPIPPADAGAIAEGRRLAQLRGCSGGCHGSEIEGSVFMDEPLLAKIVAPNLSAAVRRYSDAELARIIRRGVRPDGRSVVVMPGAMFSTLSATDLGKILAYLHSVPPPPGPDREVRLGPLARLGLALGKYQTAAQLVHRADSQASAYPPPGDPAATGAYLARTVCTECHGLDLSGGEKAPDLRIAAGYSAEAFTRLLRTGKASGDRELGLMSRVARRRFSHFNDAEIRALRSYLLARAGQRGGRETPRGLSAFNGRLRVLGAEAGGTVALSPRASVDVHRTEVTARCSCSRPSS